MSSTSRRLKRHIIQSLLTEKTIKDAINKTLPPDSQPKHNSIHDRRTSTIGIQEPRPALRRTLDTLLHYPPISPPIHPLFNLPSFLWLNGTPDEILQETNVTFFTAPSGPSSINNDADCHESAQHCLPHLLPLLPRYDAVLIACYSEHPLVGLLSNAHHAETNNDNSTSVFPSRTKKKQPIVMGIFESSIHMALRLLRTLPEDKDAVDENDPAVCSSTSSVSVKVQASQMMTFGIVTTGKAWAPLLSAGVHRILQDYLNKGRNDDDNHDEKGFGSSSFEGVQTTGLDADQLHAVPHDELRERMVKATRKLVCGGRVGVVCLGCAGMAGLDEMVREACVLEMGVELGSRVRIVDGVVAGVALLLEALSREA
ncbi:MAG: hypothetical protein M1825_005121 [Sarcosagium campestre]|nr:MAG: hypothetical protein M1825_005121 [Sarcosagium campestre]